MISTIIIKFDRNNFTARSQIHHHETLSHIHLSAENSIEIIDPKLINSRMLIDKVTAEKLVQTFRIQPKKKEKKKKDERNTQNFFRFTFCGHTSYDVVHGVVSSFELNLTSASQ